MDVVPLLHPRVLRNVNRVLPKPDSMRAIWRLEFLREADLLAVMRRWSLSWTSERARDYALQEVEVFAPIPRTSLSAERASDGIQFQQDQRAHQRQLQHPSPEAPGAAAAALELPHRQPASAAPLSSTLARQVQQTLRPVAANWMLPALMTPRETIEIDCTPPDAAAAAFPGPRAPPSRTFSREVAAPATASSNNATHDGQPRRPL